MRSRGGGERRLLCDGEWRLRLASRDLERELRRRRAECDRERVRRRRSLLRERERVRLWSRSRERLLLRDFFDLDRERERFLCLLLRLRLRLLSLRLFLLLSLQIIHLKKLLFRTNQPKTKLTLIWMTTWTLLLSHSFPQLHHHSWPSRCRLCSHDPCAHPLRCGLICHLSPLLSRSVSILLFHSRCPTSILNINNNYKTFLN